MPVDSLFNSLRLQFQNGAEPGTVTHKKAVALMAYLASSEKNSPEPATATDGNLIQITPVGRRGAHGVTRPTNRLFDQTRCVVMALKRSFGSASCLTPASIPEW